MYFITMSVLRGILIKRHYCFMCLHSHDFVKANVTRKHSVKVTNSNECKDFNIVYLHTSQGSCTGTHPLWGFWESIFHHPLFPLKLSRGAVRTGRNVGHGERRPFFQVLPVFLHLWRTGCFMTIPSSALNSIMWLVKEGRWMVSALKWVCLLRPLVMKWTWYLEVIWYFPLCAQLF